MGQSTASAWGLLQQDGPQAPWEVQGAGASASAKKHRTRSPWARDEEERHPSHPREARVPFVPFPPGFFITELQRKQAMLNASRRQAAWKPKGKRWWSHVHPWQPGPSHHRTLL